jgi:hypothetical protein
MMSTIRNATLLVIACTLVLPAAARDEQKLYPIGQALKSPAAQGKVDPGIRLFFGRQRHPNVTKDFGEWPTNKKTNAFAKSDLQACEWVFLSAVIALQERARKEGGNAVINIVSNSLASQRYSNKLNWLDEIRSSETSDRCESS